MPLILAIEPDRRQAAQLSVVVRKRVDAELILVDTTERALDAIGNRMPDLVLVPALLSPQDDAALAAALRVIAAAARVQMLTIPVLGTAKAAPRAGGVLSVLRRGKARAAETDGCDPAMFAEQIASYLERAAQERPNPAPNIVAADAIEADFLVDEEPRESDEPAASDELAASDEPTVSYEPAMSYEPAVSSYEPAASFGPAVSSEPVAADEPAEVSAASEESVSIALEEAVRGLFADAAPFVVSADPLPVSSVNAEDWDVSTSFAEEAVEEVIEVETVEEPHRPEGDEWAAVQELIAALQVMPLSAIEITTSDDWIAPVLIKPSEAVIDEPEDIDLAKALKDASRSPEPEPAPAPSEREWVALIESLRRDVDRLRVERSEKPRRKITAPRAARSDNQKAKPVQDEWGFFDPQQCGFAALLAKLDEVTESEDNRVKH